MGQRISAKLPDKDGAVLVEVVMNSECLLMSGLRNRIGVAQSLMKALSHALFSEWRLGIIQYTDMT